MLIHERLKHLRIPERMQNLPLNDKGWIVPRFVQYLFPGEDKRPAAFGTTGAIPDFRIMDHAHLINCINFSLCWVCGQKLGTYRAFVIGPMCAINRVSQEPPSHRECAEFSAKACPFLTMPKMVRREDGLPEVMQSHGEKIRDHGNSGGIAILRNPGVALVWIVKGGDGFRIEVYDNGKDILFRVGDPTETLWFAEGRPATRSEVLASIESGIPELHKMAEQQGTDALQDLQKKRDHAMRYLPAA